MIYDECIAESLYHQVNCACIFSCKFKKLIPFSTILHNDNKAPYFTRLISSTDLVRSVASLRFKHCEFPGTLTWDFELQERFKAWEIQNIEQRFGYLLDWLYLVWCLLVCSYFLYDIGNLWMKIVMHDNYVSLGKLISWNKLQITYRISSLADTR